MAESAYSEQGYSIPYALSDSEITAFLSRHPEITSQIQEAAPGQWVSDGLPDYGVIVTEAYGQLLVWIDASSHLHVIDVTNLAISEQVQKAPYTSADDTSFWTSLLSGLQSVAVDAAKGAYSIVNMLALAAVAVLVIYAFPRR